MYYWIFSIFGFCLGMIGIFPFMFGLMFSKFVAVIAAATPMLSCDYYLVTIFKERPDLQINGIVRPIFAVNVGYTLAVALFSFLFLRHVL